MIDPMLRRPNTCWFSWPFRLWFIISLFCLGQVGSSFSQVELPELLTIAEQSGYQTSANYHQVVALVGRMAGKYPLARQSELGKSQAGHAIPLLVAAKPAVASPAEAVEQIKKGKLVVLILGSTRVGEDDLPEAILTMARETLSNPEQTLLNDLILLFAPVTHPDASLDLITAKNTRADESQNIRRELPGPDFDDDFIKLEAPETRALVRALTQWHPALVIDLHRAKTDHQGQRIACNGPQPMAGNSTIMRFIDQSLFPHLTQKLPFEASISNQNPEELMDGERPSRSEHVLPLDCVTYLSLRGQLGISLACAGLSQRAEAVACVREVLKACLEVAVQDKELIRKSTESAESRTASVSQTKPSESFPKGGSVSTSKNGHREPILKAASSLPYAFIMPGTWTKVSDVLQRQGIEVEEFREDMVLNVEKQRIETIQKLNRETEARQRLKLNITYHRANQKILAGTVLVRTSQPLGPLASFMLEPQSVGGLASWGFFTTVREPGSYYPVSRLVKPTPINRGRVRPLAEDRVMNKPITFAAIYESDSPPNFSGSPMSAVRWFPKGRYFLQTKEGELQKVEAATGGTTLFLNKARLAQALAKIPVIDEKAAADLASHADANLSPDMTAAFFNYQNDLYYARLDGKAAWRLTNTPQAEELASFSPDGRFIAFVRANNLYVVDVQTRNERALTQDGNEQLLNGKADWVYYEEVFDRNHRAYWWSPDSQRIAFFQTDDSPVKTYTLANDLSAAQTLERTPYPRPGEPNPRVRLGIVTVAGGTPYFARFANYDIEGHLITGVGWWPDSSAVYCYIQNRAQTWLDFCALPASGGQPRLLFRDRTQAWIEAPAEPHFLKDASFLITSERNGWQHLYHYDQDGKCLGSITAGNWELRKILQVNETNNWIYFTGTKDSSLAENLYRVHLDGSGLTRLTLEPGQHQVELSPTGEAFVDHWSDRTTPAKAALYRADGSLWRMLDTNPVYVREEYRFGDSRQFQIKTADAFCLEAAWVKPPDFEPGNKYPVWFTTYSGPHMPSIRDAWNGGSVWDQVLAQEGIVVFHLDPRSASGKGAQSAWTAYRQLGVQELKDITEAIQWLTKQAWIDSRRIGMSGYSYGGFMTSYALTHSDLFAAGIAGAPPTDWRDYDSVYTERYMSTPQDNPEGYENTSVVKAAKNLHGKLLLVHGTMDDNVHPGNTLKLVKAFQDARQHFELMVYPGARHGISSKHFQREQYDFILKTIGKNEERIGKTTSLDAGRK